MDIHSVHVNLYVCMYVFIAGRVYIFKCLEYYIFVYGMQTSRTQYLTLISSREKQYLEEKLKSLSHD